MLDHPAELKPVPAKLPASAEAVVADRIYAVGGWHDLKLRPSWIPKEIKGWLPLQCYVLRGRGRVVIMNTGMNALWPEMRDGLAATLGGATDVELWFNRLEMDCAQNLPLIVRDFGVGNVRTGGIISPLDLFSSLEDAYAKAQIKVAEITGFEFLSANQEIDVAPMHFTILVPPLRVLQTLWIYERTTRTLFTSDSFGILTRPQPSASRILTGQDATITTEMMLGYLSGKFDWLLGIDTTPMRSGIEKIMTSFKIDRICPDFGCIIEGPDAVQRAFDATIDALAIMQGAKRKGVFADFKMPTLA